MKVRNPFVVHFAERATEKDGMLTFVVSTRVMIDGDILTARRTISKMHDTSVVTDTLRKEMYRELIIRITDTLSPPDVPHSYT